jgi:hypothetical protein
MGKAGEGVIIYFISFYFFRASGRSALRNMIGRADPITIISKLDQILPQFEAQGMKSREHVSISFNATLICQK